VNEGAAAPSVVDRPDQRRFVAELDGHTAELVYRAEPGRLVLVHTGVSPELQGRGIGGALVRAAIARAADQGLTVVPWCPFAREWLRAHPDAASGVTVDWNPPEPPQQADR
jgi:predicted GNAT family acetyltransferase